MAHMGMLQLVAAEELRVIQQQEAERRMAAFQSFVESWTTPFGANVFLNPDGLVTRPIVDNILGDVPEVDARLKITSLTVSLGFSNEAAVVTNLACDFTGPCQS